MNIARMVTAMPIAGIVVAGIVMASTVMVGAALSLGLTPAASASAQTRPQQAQPQQAQPQQAQPRPVVLTCAKAKVTRPRSFTLACGDGTESLGGIAWSGWRLNLAAGRGYDSINDCTPSCADGKYQNYPVRVTFKGSAAVYGHPGMRRYTTYTLTYTGKRPPEQQGPTRTGQLWP